MSEDDFTCLLHVLRPKKGDVLVVTAEPDRWPVLEAALAQLGHRAMYVAPGETVTVTR